MGDGKSTSARRKSRRLANVVAVNTTQRTNTQQPSSPEPTAVSVSGSDYDLSTSIDFSGTPNSDTLLSLDQKDDDSSSSINITPPPLIKRKAPSKAQKLVPQKAASKKATSDHESEITLSSDSEDDVVQPPKKKSRGKKAKGGETEMLSHDKRQLVLSVPRASEPGNQRITLTHATTFNEALAVIHSTVGCTDVTRKPVLTYKLSNATAKVPATSLSTDEDWKGCLEDVRQAESAKKAGVLIPVMILVTEQYLNSLSVKRGKAKPSIGKGRSKKPVILDLDHAESGDDDFDDGLGTMDHEIKCMEQLDNQYGHCQACGPTKFCKITVAGTHHHLTNGQRRAWAQALALGKNGVTLKTPPRDVAGQNLFGMFFKSMPGEVGPPGPPMPSLFSGMMPQQMMGYPYMPWGLPGHSHMSPMPPIMSAAPSSFPHASTSALPAVIPSSDPPEMGALNPYPEIPNFLHELDGYNPRRNLLDYIPVFGALDYYNIDEIHKLGTAEELVRIAKITHGNATYIMAEVKNEIKRVDRHRRTLA
ncbi:hypothetical protein B0H19DRAFT_1239731 [Mycena capillaripes]|nr:hypothetical protein B0H19DRAFT_1381531 [Mycena capillaripes]KAJ6540353.1 hypothetical protein B0H19DRAFT_1239687 [Mycena capillaripes]KAJ6540479.1 hypothetical protein B0H19DRAFT_1239731 [Mycena capillaripes]